MTATEINQNILKSKACKICSYPCNNLRASNIGHPCERYLYLLIRHWDEQKPHDVGLQQIFDLGNHLEEHAINTLKEAGFEVITPVQRSWKIDSPLITGREDIRIKDPGTGQLFPAEIKWLSPMEYDKLNNPEDFYHSKKHYIRGYPAQLLVYMYYFAKEMGYFVLGNKLTGAIKVIDFPLDWNRADELLKKGERIYKALNENVIEILSQTDDFSVCDKCNLAHICGAEIIRSEADIDAFGELAELIDEKNKLYSCIERYNDLSDEIKRHMTGKEKVISRNYLILSKLINCEAYRVPEKSYMRISVHRLN